jgi:acetoin utilization deacetylase AcuC-like enzyme
MPAKPPRLWFSPAYELEWEGHVFPASKYRKLRDRLLAEAVARLEDIAEPAPLDRRSLLLGHTADYLDRLEAMTANPQLGLYEFEAPCTRRVLDAFYAMAGGTLAACRSALLWSDAGRGGFAANLGGGFHHAFPWKGEGFCAINDIVVALRVLLHDRAIDRAAVVDLDVHQGNGTAKAFEGEDRVFTCSLHQENNDPVKQRSDLDVGLPDGCDDALYLQELRDALALVVAARPQLVVYVAGADPYRLDQLGGLALSIEGLAARDRLVYDAFRPLGVPVAACLAGGYAARESDVVEIHFRMVRQGLDTNPP